MSSAFAKRACILVLGLGLTVVLAGCGEEPPAEQRLKAAIDSLVTAVEAGTPRDAGDVLHPEYRDDRHPDKRSALASLFWYTRQHRDIHLFTLMRDADIDEATGIASTTVLVAMAGVPLQSIESVISVRADLYRFDVDWRLADGEWLVTSSRWQRADLSALTGNP
jgi:hypothetical protein